MSRSPVARTELIAALSLSARRAIVDTVLLFEIIAGRMGINATDLQCLNILDYEGAVPAGRLAELTGLTTGAITSAVDRLEKAGYVQRLRDHQDRRRVIVQKIPRDGLEVFGSIDHLWQEVYSRYGDQELAVILAFFETLHEMHQEVVIRLHSDGPHMWMED